MKERDSDYSSFGIGRGSFTVAVINFCLGNVLGGIGDALMAYALYYSGQVGRMAYRTRKALCKKLNQKRQAV